MEPLWSPVVATGGKVPAHVLHLGQRWMVDSPHHRENLLNPIWTEQGIDVTQAKHFQYGLDAAVWAPRIRSAPELSTYYEMCCAIQFSRGRPGYKRLCLRPSAQRFGR